MKQAEISETGKGEMKCLMRNDQGTESNMIQRLIEKIIMADWAYIIHEYVVPAIAGIVGSFIGLAIVLLLKLKTG